MSSHIFSFFGSVAATGITSVLWMKIPHCLNCVVSYPNNVTMRFWQWKYSQLLKGLMINTRSTVMFENKDLKLWTKHRDVKHCCRNGIRKECYESGSSVRLIGGIRECLSDMVRHPGKNISDNIYLLVFLTKWRHLKKPTNVQSRLQAKEMHHGIGMWFMNGTNLLISKVSSHPDAKHFSEDSTRRVSEAHSVFSFQKYF